MGDPTADVERAMVTIRRSQARRTLGRRARAQGARYDPAVAEVLDAVDAGAPASVGDVADALGVDQPRASRMVARVVDLGLVDRAADGRRAALSVTAAGRAQLDRTRAFRCAVFAEAMAGWPDGDAAEFARLLTAFVAGLTPAAPPASAAPVPDPSGS